MNIKFEVEAIEQLMFFYSWIQKIKYCVGWYTSKYKMITWKVYTCDYFLMIE